MSNGILLRVDHNEFWLFEVPSDISHKKIPLGILRYPCARLIHLGLRHGSKCLGFGFC
jgi:hypothetical protein